MSQNSPRTDEEREEKTLQGWIPPLATDDEIRAALEKAFDYRGDITLTLKDGSKIEGYLFDRSTGATLASSTASLFPKDRDEKVFVRYSDIARLEFSGKDTAHGKSFETWMKKYQEKRRPGRRTSGSSRRSWINPPRAYRRSAHLLPIYGRANLYPEIPARAAA